MRIALLLLVLSTALVAPAPPADRQAACAVWCECTSTAKTCTRACNADDVLANRAAHCHSRMESCGDLAMCVYGKGKHKEHRR